MIRLCKLLFVFVLGISIHSTGQQTLRIMSYNLLNFPSASPPGRIDTLAKILDYYKPNLFLMQELRSESGLFQITQRMNSLGYSNFAQVPYMPLMSSPTNPFAQVQGLVYDTNILRFKRQYPILTDLRDINEYVLYFNTPSLPAGDTTFLYVYVCHLKAGTGSVNSNDRLAMVNNWLEYVNGRVTPNDHVIFAGDLNVYNNNELAYQALTNPSSPLPLNDVFAPLGNWSSAAFPHKYIHTQSTRVNVIHGDGASGGMDDRFDFILFSNPLVNPDHEIHFVEGSYRSLGNTGECYNQNITDCADDNEVPFSVLRALYHMSDHLPQVCELSYSIQTGVNESTSHTPEFYLTGSAIAHSGYCIHTNRRVDFTFTLTDLTGREISHWSTLFDPGKTCLNLPEEMPNGTFLLRIGNDKGEQSVRRIVVREP